MGQEVCCRCDVVDGGSAVDRSHNSGLEVIRELVEVPLQQLHISHGGGHPAQRRREWEREFRGLCVGQLEAARAGPDELDVGPGGLGGEEDGPHRRPVRSR